MDALTLPEFPDDYDHTVVSLAAGDILSRRYSLVRELGRGGMGVVWLASDLALDRQVAVKVLPLALTGSVRSITRLKREAVLTMDLAHPHIAPVHNFEQDPSRDNLAYLVMQFVQGKTIDELLAESPGGLPLDRVLVWAGQLAGALDYAHGRQVLHRDIKPSNIMVDTAGMAYLMDFGVARVAKDTVTRVTGKQSSGTLLYMSPQQIIGQSHPANDIYSFATTLYEALNGEPPFTSGDLVTQIRSVTPERIKAQPEHINEALASGLAKELKARPRSATALVNAMRAAPPPVTPAAKAEPAKQVRKIIAPPARPAGIVPTGLTALDPKPGDGGWALKVKEPRTGMILMLIPSGEYLMGTGFRDPNERPVHRVRIPAPFYLARTPVTQAEWVTIMGAGSNHSYFLGDARPIECVSWYECREYLKSLNTKAPERWRYALPSEAQWEYACRARSTGAYWFGDSLKKASNHAWIRGNSGGRTHSVGWPGHESPWGLIDMHGNVWEWCEDCYHDSYDGAPDDGTARRDGNEERRVIRGGSWRNPAKSCRSANRRRADGSKRYRTLGFRPALLLESS